MISARTPQDEPTYPARGPFFGNTEITITGSGFFAASGVKCRLYDSGTTNNIKEVDGFFDNMNRVRCITPDHEPISGGEVPGTIRPCLTKSIEVTLDGSTYSAVKSNVNFLYCDVYVSKSGSDAYGDGTPSAPYLTLQRSIEAALDEPRSYDLRYELANLTRVFEARRSFANEIRNSLESSSQQRFRILREPGQNSSEDRDVQRSWERWITPVRENAGGRVDRWASVCRLRRGGIHRVLVSGDRHGNEEVTNSEVCPSWALLTSTARDDICLV